MEFERLITVDWVKPPKLPTYQHNLHQHQHQRQHQTYQDQNVVRNDTVLFGGDGSDAHLPPPYALQLVRKVLATPPRLSPMTVVWIQRAKARSRRIDNEAVLIGLLRQRLSRNHPDARFELFTDNPSPPAEAAFRLFSRATVVVGLHGAGLANTVLMKAGGHVVVSLDPCLPSAPPSFPLSPPMPPSPSLSRCPFPSLPLSPPPLPPHPSHCIS